MGRKRALLGLIATSVLLAACAGGDELILATTTSTDNTGLLEELVPIFEERTGINVKVIAVGTGAALRMASEGNADALLVHAPDAERELLLAGDVINRQLVAYNDFVLLGPPSDPAVVAGEPDVETALQNLIGDRDLLGEADRMVQRHDEAHRAETYPAGTGARRDCVEAGRGHPALVGPEMMLDAEAVFEAKLVGQPKLAPELLVALGRRHAGLAPDMCEMGEFHGGRPLDSCRVIAGVASPGRFYATRQALSD